jgi:DNA-binding GntR family transcriptional regulator
VLGVEVRTVEPSFSVIRSVAPVRQQVLENLRRAIVEGHFRPADRLVERELCALTGASRSSVREALRQLEAEGLIETVPDRGPVVRTVSAAESEDLYQVRALLEGLVGRLFATRATGEEIEDLREAVDDLRRSIKAKDTVAALRAKDHFYDVLMTGSRNGTLDALLQSLRNRIALLRATTLAQPGRSAKTLIEIERILAAIEKRDPDAAWAACVAHVEAAGAVALAVLGGRPPQIVSKTSASSRLA